ncbi:MAG: formimidoylglutamase [Lautropia sp.]|nr:formimidoylglutamase [Lautropia sp.]
MTGQDVWQGRNDVGEAGDTRRVFDIVQRWADSPDAESVRHATVYAGDPVLLGFACDAGVRRNQGRTGAADGPVAIRRMLAGMALHGLTTLHDAGDIRCLDDGLEQAQDVLAASVCALLAQQMRPLVIGGGHEVAWGSWQGLRRYLDRQGDRDTVLILNLDAHFDLRTSRPASSGTPFDQMAVCSQQNGLPFCYGVLGISRLGNTAGLFARAHELGVRWREDEQMQERHLSGIQATVAEWLEQAAHVYLSIDLDTLPGSVMPAVSAPAPYGVPMSVLETVIMQVASSGKLRLVDMAEFNPTYDQDQRGARTAARLIYQALRAWLTV